MERERWASEQGANEIAYMDFAIKGPTKEKKRKKKKKRRKPWPFSFLFFFSSVG